MNKTIKKEIMAKIENNEIKMKPKWWFVAKLEAMRGGTVVMLLAGVLAWAMMVYKAEVDTPLELLDYDELGREIMILDFPYIFLICGIILATGAGLLSLKIGDNYKKGIKIILGMIAIGLIGLTIVATIIRKMALL